MSAFSQTKRNISNFQLVCSVYQFYKSFTSGSVVHTHTLTHTQLEQEVDALNRKLKLLEADLDTAEDKAADQTDKVKELETQNEELLRENKQLQRKVELLEGMTG